MAYQKKFFFFFFESTGQSDFFSFRAENTGRLVLLEYFLCVMPQNLKLTGIQPDASFPRHMKIQTSCLYAICVGLVAETFQ